MTPAITGALLHDHGMLVNLLRRPPRHHDHDIGPVIQASPARLRTPSYHQYFQDHF